MALTIPDHIAALRAYLLSAANADAGTEGRIYGAEVPQSEHANMPRRAILLRDAGGYVLPGSQVDIEIGDPRVDILCYGATPFEAKAVWRAVHPHMRRLNREVWSQTLLHWARQGGGPNGGIDADTKWPFILSSYQVLASEVVVTS